MDTYDDLFDEFVDLSMPSDELENPEDSPTSSLKVEEPQAGHISLSVLEAAKVATVADLQGAPSLALRKLPYRAAHLASQNAMKVQQTQDRDHDQEHPVVHPRRSPRRRPRDSLEMAHPRGRAGKSSVERIEEAATKFPPQFDLTETHPIPPPTTDVLSQCSTFERYAASAADVADLNPGQGFSHNGSSRTIYNTSTNMWTFPYSNEQQHITPLSSPTMQGHGFSPIPYTLTFPMPSLTQCYSPEASGISDFSSQAFNEAFSWEGQTFSTYEPPQSTSPGFEETTVQPWWPPPPAMPQLSSLSRSPTTSKKVHKSGPTGFQGHRYDPSNTRYVNSQGLQIHGPPNPIYPVGDEAALINRTNTGYRTAPETISRKRSPMRDCAQPTRCASRGRSPVRSNRSKTPTTPTGKGSMRGHRRSKTISGTCRSGAVEFVNMTMANSEKLMAGVAPSGSSKTKARREKEAQDRRRRFSEAAKKAVLEGNLAPLEQEGMFV